MIFDHVPFVGVGGALASIGLGHVNEIVGITVGVLTGIYIIFKTIKLLQEWKNGKD